MKTSTGIVLVGSLLTAGAIALVLGYKSMTRGPSPAEIAAENRAQETSLLSLHQKAGSSLETLAIGDELDVQLATDKTPVDYKIRFLGYDSTGARLGYEIRDVKGKLLSQGIAGLDGRVIMCWDDTAFGDSRFVHGNQFSLLPSCQKTDHLSASP